MPDIDVTDRQVGREYGDPTPACLDAIVTMATSEGVLLDPVYSGKVAAGLFAAARAGEIEPGSTAVAHLYCAR